jgi:hypothetical protein
MHRRQASSGISAKIQKFTFMRKLGIFRRISPTGEPDGDALSRPGQSQNPAPFPGASGRLRDGAGGKLPKGRENRKTLGNRQKHWFLAILPSPGRHHSLAVSLLQFDGH